MDRRTMPTRIPEPQLGSDFGFFADSSEDTSDDFFIADSRDFSSRMANIFSEMDEDESSKPTAKNNIEVSEKSAPTSSSSSSSAQSSTPYPLFTAKVFLSQDESTGNTGSCTKVGLAIVKKSEQDEAKILLYDSSKRGLCCQPIHNSTFSFSKSNLSCTFTIDASIGHTKQVSITFIEELEFRRFAAQALLFSSTNIFDLELGDGETIVSGCLVQYDTVIYNGQSNNLLLPTDSETGRQSKVTEKPRSLPNFIGHRKGEVFMQKMDTSVIEVHVRRVKFPKRKDATKAIGQAEDVDSSIAEASSSSTREGSSEINEVVGDSRKEHKILEEHKSHDEFKEVADPLPNSTSEPVPVPRSKVAHTPSPDVPIFHPSTVTSTELHDLLTRIVGIEIDRMELRTTERFKQILSPIVEKIDNLQASQERILDELKLLRSERR